MTDSKLVTNAGSRRPPAAGQGRKKGVPNKVTREFRETVNKLLTENADNVCVWLTRVAEGGGGKAADPGRALELLAKLAEYAVPKLGRIEHAGPNGGPIEMAAVDLSHLTIEQLRVIASIRVPGHDD
jgi:hypothetical protein